MLQPNSYDKPHHGAAGSRGVVGWEEAERPSSQTGGGLSCAVPGTHLPGEEICLLCPLGVCCCCEFLHHQSVEEHQTTWPALDFPLPFAAQEQEERREGMAH